MITKIDEIIKETSEKLEMYVNKDIDDIELEIFDIAADFVEKIIPHILPKQIPEKYMEGYSRVIKTEDLEYTMKLYTNFINSNSSKKRYEAEVSFFSYLSTMLEDVVYKLYLDHEKVLLNYCEDIRCSDSDIKTLFISKCIINYRNILEDLDEGSEILKNYFDDENDNRDKLLKYLLTELTRRNTNVFTKEISKLPINHFLFHQ